MIPENATVGVGVKFKKIFSESTLRSVFSLIMKKFLALSLAATSGMPLASNAEVAVTIYNQNLAVVRDSLPITLQAGDNEISYDRATAQVIPDSVVLRDPTGEAFFFLREQSYRNDPISQGLLLSLFEGKEIPFQKIYPDGEVELIPGTVVRSGYQAGGRGQSSPVIETSQGLQFSLPGEPIFPTLGDHSILRPTLSWTLGAEANVSFEGQLSYLSRGLSWQASYNLVAPEEGDVVTLSGWITATNNSGTLFENAKLKLVAGDVNVVPLNTKGLLPAISRSTDSFASAPAVAEKAFDDFHLYTLPNPITLRDKETKQVEFLRSAQVTAQKSYLYEPLPYRFAGGRNVQRHNISFSQDIAIYWNFSNSEENGLGVPMPKGIVRFYREDSEDGNLEFVGENNINHTATEEELSIYTGKAFDLIGERKVTNFLLKDRANRLEETIEITLKNRSKKGQTITAREHLYRWSNWELETKTEYEKVDANTIEFTETLAPNEVRTFSYQVIYTW